MSILPSEPYRMVKRGLDLVGALLLLVGLSPILALVAACIWLEDGRPLLFTQTRAGKGGTPFRIIKFRSLATEPDDPTQPAAHATRVGAVLRRWGLDELPQLVNVLRGEMSLVGPRPPLLRDVAKYGPRERVRLNVRPGVTGWAQIHGRNELSWDERISLDHWYVRNRGLWLDLQILFRTPFVLMQGKGVYGPDGQTPSFSSSKTDPYV